MTARNSFWYAFAEMLYRSYYLVSYKQRVLKIQKILNCFLIVVSSTSISAWTLWGKYPVLWAILTAASQLISLVMPYFRYSEIVTCINFCIPELDIITSEMEAKWQIIDSLKDQEIVKECAKFEKRYNELDAKYLSPLDFPDKKSCQKSAMRKRDMYLSKYTKATESEVII